MAACGSLQHIFEKSLPESSTTLLQSLSSSWKPLQPLEDSSSSYTDFFGELHFKENTDNNNINNTNIKPISSLSSDPLPLLTPSFSSSSLSQVSSSTSPPQRQPETTNLNSKENNEGRIYITSTQKKHYRHNDSFSSMNSESLSLCTEGLGFESCDDIEDPVVKKNDWKHWEGRSSITRHVSNEYFSGNRSRIIGKELPPPISSIGRSGKPWICFKSYRNNGRFVLKEVRIPTQEFLHTCREDGRLKLQYIHSDDEIIEEDDDDDVDDRGEEACCRDEHVQSLDHDLDIDEENERNNGEMIVKDEDRESSKPPSSTKSSKPSS